MHRDYIPDGRYFRVSNFIFNYDLTPIERSVYFYLLCAAGARGSCWPSMKTIARKCRRSVNAARKATQKLDEKRFIKTYHTHQDRENGFSRQGNNHYFIQPLPSGWREPESVTYTMVDKDGTAIDSDTQERLERKAQNALQ